MSVAHTDVKDAVKAKLDNSEAFTSACISHPMISSDKNVRHRDVSDQVKRLWRHRQMSDAGGEDYLRTLVTVYPDGPGTTPAQAYLYYPDNGFDPHSFVATSRVLIRNHGDDDGITVTNTADGSSVSKQCQVQSIDKSLNVPKFIMKKLGWNAGDGLTVKWNNGIEIKRTDTAAPGSQKVDQEGRVRLHGGTVTQLGVNNPTAMLVEPDTGDSYILISALAQTPPPASTDDSDSTDDSKDTVTVGRGISVWDDDEDKS